MPLPLDGQSVPETAFRETRRRHSSRASAQEYRTTHFGRQTRLSKRTWVVFRAQSHTGSAGPRSRKHADRTPIGLPLPGARRRSSAALGGSCPFLVEARFVNTPGEVPATSKMTSGPTS
jgi:hypothetical protein